jgi:ankyrin repeat protein
MQDGWTPLYLAAMTSQLEVLCLLLEKGANKEAACKVA